MHFYHQELSLEISAFWSFSGSWTIFIILEYNNLLLQHQVEALLVDFLK